MPTDLGKPTERLGESPQEYLKGVHNMIWKNFTGRPGVHISIWIIWRKFTGQSEERSNEPLEIVHRKILRKIQIILNWKRKILSKFTGRSLRSLQYDIEEAPRKIWKK